MLYRRVIPKEINNSDNIMLIINPSLFPNREFIFLFRFSSGLYLEIYIIISSGIKPIMYDINADIHEFIPAPSLRIDTDIPKKVVTV